MEGVRSWLAAGTAVLAVTVGVASNGCGASSQTVTTVDPAATFAPIVRFDARERWYPMSAQWFLDRSALSWVVDLGCPDVQLAAGDKAQGATTSRLPLLRPSGLGKGPPYRFAETDPDCRPYGPRQYVANEFSRPYTRKVGINNEGFYLDLDDRARKGEREPRRQGGQLSMGPIPAYVENTASRVDGGDGVRLSYWLLYGRHEAGKYGAGFWEPTHEGDWERFDVLLEREGDEEYEPFAVSYRYDGRRRQRPWDSLVLDGDGSATHPVLEAERGTHQMRPARTDGACDNCAKWDTEAALERLDDQDWVGFGGAWGDLGREPAEVGPVGPHGGHGLPTLP